MLSFLFPRKCILCRKLLTPEETDLCHGCRKTAEIYSSGKRTIPFVAHLTAIWYYKDNVRKSIQRFKFYNARSYADAYARILALRLQDSSAPDADIITWAPISPLRRIKRGYDQAKLLAKATAKELGANAVSTLRKTRHTPPQSTLADASARRANVLGAYKVRNRDMVAGKSILLFDDVVTTGSTVSECAKTLLAAGAKEVRLAAIAATSHDK